MLAELPMPVEGYILRYVAQLPRGSVKDTTHVPFTPSAWIKASHT